MSGDKGLDETSWSERDKKVGEKDESKRLTRVRETKVHLSLSVCLSLKSAQSHLFVSTCLSLLLKLTGLKPRLLPSVSVSWV
ncbi:hypothetical protein Pcinc_031730 [Petrolisthes cinctipes]|uniref:Uncharacterized protein n=1 Tax=Petrolisthes cinctipes TaxID=88211 RepID=A0AAE1EW10_PETCI|nr:hypothetical protein Pcinc_031730 [Petrolisthes cinctipes]